MMKRFVMIGVAAGALSLAAAPMMTPWGEQRLRVLSNNKSAGNR